MPAAEHAVVADKLTRRFGPVYGVRNLSLSLPPSRVLLVMGPNGSGKTTFLRLLATALKPTAGRVWIFGVDLTSDPQAVRRCTAFVPASPGLYGGLTARENLAFAATMSSIRTDPLLWLQRAGLESVADRPARELSQGMKRRLALTRAWLRTPRLLLLDEPFNGLDRNGVHLVETLIAEVKADGGSVVICTHEWERGMALADLMIELQGGRLVEPAAPAGLSVAGR